ncbi:hypothetical protein DXC96_06700 [Enterocloster bolteae]|uniref:Uncharacterized protein n=1 Tax=Enterocloster bolteae TaxID=208479 RepID=A0A414AUM1_9FIRM|nr:hypothetical protein DXC96_06700 [Enterocloster bolteae]RHC55307.1 hypothetical protein DW839_15445 [Enterocloster bolteae]
MNAYLTNEYMDGYQVSYSVMTEITNVIHETEQVQSVIVSRFYISPCSGSGFMIKDKIQTIFT